MTEKSNCVFTLQSLLNERFTTIFASGTNLYAAQTFQDLVLTANSLNDGYWLLQPKDYRSEPSSSQLISKQSKPDQSA